MMDELDQEILEVKEPDEPVQKAPEPKSKKDRLKLK